MKGNGYSYNSLLQPQTQLPERTQNETQKSRRLLNPDVVLAILAVSLLIGEAFPVLQEPFGPAWGPSTSRGAGHSPFRVGSYKAEERMLLLVTMDLYVYLIFPLFPISGKESARGA